MPRQRRDTTYKPMLGKTFLDRQTDSERFPVLRIGSESWSRAKFARDFGIPNTQAAHTVGVVAKQIGAKDVKDFYKRSSVSHFAQAGIGATTLYVLFHVFAAKGLNVKTWYSSDPNAAVRTFATLKKRDAIAEKRTKKKGK